ncbi:hypothetical protein LOK49_LG13G00499 [Camellia lanceoleosa]|uniref:Uncharacterized protein n=1 Tax=Camellia lanceoleosa TaxID=1840588 RepID=A0ACC0FIC1_9ERIC|nr:hypothetical protein LOK49_LG13G00499 [Camellia lanceoleosa]
MLKYREAFAKRMATAGLKPHHRIDKISGKLVLGFGVIWWSATTVLTPIAAKVGLPLLLVMHAFMGIGEGKPLSKVKISGGGRCNVTNGHCSDNLTEDDGRVFPVSNNSSSVVDCLLSEAKQRGGPQLIVAAWETTRTIYLVIDW